MVGSSEAATIVGRLLALHEHPLEGILLEAFAFGVLKGASVWQAFPVATANFPRVPLVYFPTESCSGLTSCPKSFSIISMYGADTGQVCSGSW